MRARPVRFSVRIGLRLCGMAGRAFLALGEEFLGFEHFGALQVADLGRDALDRRGDDAKGGKEHRMAVARDDLGRDRLGLKAHGPLQHVLQRLGRCWRRCRRRREMAQVATSSRAARRRVLAAVELCIGFGHLQAEGHRLGMNAMGATDADGVLVFEGAALGGSEQGVEIGQQKIGCFGQLDVEAGVEHVRGGHALMDETGVWADDFGKMGQKRYDVVLGFALDLVNPVDVKSCCTTFFPRWFSLRSRE